MRSVLFMCKTHAFQFELNNIYYYVDQKIILLKIFEEIQMAKIRYLNSEYESIVDMKGISEVPIFENSISIKLLGGEKG